MLYPYGFKHIMCRVPENFRALGYPTLYKNLYNPDQKQRVEQICLRQISLDLQKQGKSYPEELPKLTEKSLFDLQTDWTNEHTMDPVTAQTQYDRNIGSMLGKNPGGFVNHDQYNFVKSIEEQLTLQKQLGDDYEGHAVLLQAPAGCGKTFALETLFAYCNLPGNEYLVLCSAFSGVAAQLLPGGMTIHKRFRMTPRMSPDTLCKILTKSCLLYTSPSPRDRG